MFDLTTSLSIIIKYLIKNCFLQNRSEKNRKLFCKQRNKCVSFLRKPTKDYFARPNEKNITDNKRFWKTVKPFLSKNKSIFFLKELISLKKKKILC